MRFPVKFISIEKELEPVAIYLKGNVLNAGCGDRDITSTLKSWHATSVDNCDIQTSIPGAFLCDLTNIPKQDNAYDAILCNAVLEHVPDPEGVMTEFHRLLTPGGFLVVSVPFLQPFHPTPFDFRRFTRTGLEQLAKRASFEVLELRPVHTMAQTFGWLLWAYLEERNSTLGKLFFWLPIFIASHMFQNAPRNQTYTSNSFQAVMVKAKVAIHSEVPG